ncbi:sensor histidine kinase [Halocola ammonii]
MAEEKGIGEDLTLQGFSWKMLILVFVISVAAAYFFMGGFDNVREALVGTLWSATIWYTQWYGNGWIIDKLDDKISWVEKPLKRFFLGLFFLISYSFIAILVVNFLFNLAVNGGMPSNLGRWAFYNGMIAVSISFIISLILTSIGFLHSWRTSALEAEKYKAEMNLYKYESLRNQINPHFLFNSLNVLSSLVYEDQKLAVRFIRQLSEVYRYVLDSKDKELVTLSHELEFLEAYLFLLQIRFEENLKLELDLEPQEDLMVVPMVFQMLLENAVKHNEVSSTHPLSVKIYREGDFAVVENKIQRKSAGENSKRVGLQNIRARYQSLTDKDVKVEENQDTFRVVFPLLKIED